MSIWVDAFTEDGTLWPVNLDSDVPGLLEEAGLALEVSEPGLAFHLFAMAYRLRHTVGETPGRLVGTDATGRVRLK